MKVDNNVEITFFFLKKNLWTCTRHIFHITYHTITLTLPLPLGLLNIFLKQIGSCLYKYLKVESLYVAELIWDTKIH